MKKEALATDATGGAQELVDKVEYASVVTKEVVASAARCANLCHGLQARPNVAATPAIAGVPLSLSATMGGSGSVSSFEDYLKCKPGGRTRDRAGSG